MSSTLSDLQYRQVVDNLAKMCACPDSLPYFNVATSGKTTVQHQNQASAGLGWDLLSVAPGGILTLFNRTLLDKETLGFQLTHQNTDEWDTSPSLDPVQLLVMQGLYKKALGIPLSNIQENILNKFYAEPSTTEAVPAPAPPKQPSEGQDKGPNKELKGEIVYQTAAHKFSPDYAGVLCELYRELGPGWLCMSYHKDACPENACYVANCKNTYVWVTKRHLEQLTNLTILIIDAATRDTSQSFGGQRTNINRQVPSGPNSVYGAP
jgi:hypothetical protein